ncbi:hypothetical protein NS277_13285 [Novosphingobium barchaimii]|nr:hypothetical protein NS277_13285 [Novosphingobium barchaimii]
MMTRNTTALSAKAWRGAMDELALVASASGVAATKDRLSELVILLMLAPEPHMLLGVNAIAPDRLRALVDVEAFDTALMAMLSSPVGFLLSRGQDGESLATIALPGALQEQSASGASPALALIAALALSLGNRRSLTQSMRSQAQPAERCVLH